MHKASRPPRHRDPPRLGPDKSLSFRHSCRRRPFNSSGAPGGSASMPTTRTRFSSLRRGSGWPGCRGDRAAHCGPTRVFFVSRLGTSQFSLGGMVFAVPCTRWLNDSSRLDIVLHLAFRSLKKCIFDFSGSQLDPGCLASSERDGLRPA